MSREGAASPSRKACIDPLRRRVLEDARGPRARRAGFLATKWAARLLPGVMPPSIWQAEARPAPGPPAPPSPSARRRRSRRRSSCRRLREFVNEAAFADVVLKAGVGGMQRAGNGAVRSRSDFSRRSISATSGRPTSALRILSRTGPAAARNFLLMQALMDVGGNGDVHHLRIGKVEARSSASTYSSTIATWRRGLKRFSSPIVLTVSPL